MSEWNEYDYDDAYDEYYRKQEIEEIEYNILADEELIEERHEEFLYERNCRDVIARYGLKDYSYIHDEWIKLDNQIKVDYCNLLLKPIETDDFPLQRQVYVLTNLVNINLVDINYSKVLECAFYDNKAIDEIIIKINPFIPQKHYIEHLRKIYKISKISTLNIPEKNTTQYLQELFTIWYQHKNGSNLYSITKNLTPYNKAFYYKNEIKRKIISLKTLFK